MAVLARRIPLARLRIPGCVFEALPFVSTTFVSPMPAKAARALVLSSDDELAVASVAKAAVACGRHPFNQCNQRKAFGAEDPRAEGRSVKGSDARSALMQASRM